MKRFLQEATEGTKDLNSYFSIKIKKSNHSSLNQNPIRFLPFLL
jgi:hypothetical protein